MENDFSAIRSLQELKNLLDSGAITAEEYEVLKQKVIFGKGGMETPAAPVRSTPFVGASTPPVAPISPVMPMPQGSDPVAPEYTNESYVGFDTGRNVNRPYDPDALGPDGVREEDGVSNTKSRDMLVTTLIILGVLLLLGLIAYQLLGKKDSEKLTSTSGGEEVVTDTTAFAATPAVSPSERTFTIDSNSVRANAPAGTAAADPATVAAGAAPAAPTLTDEEIQSRVKDRLESYYDDVRSVPFSAQRHFAPAVDRYYTLTNTTPSAINENLTAYHFPEFQDSEASIEEGSMKVVTVPNGYEVTYIENGTAFRKSKAQKQQTKARVRARFDQNFKMTYFRQEQLLENNFVE